MYGGILIMDAKHLEVLNLSYKQIFDHVHSGEGPETV